ncbi:GntR family transcriptional regulator [Marinimicrococcus flavescens]|uniref:GntR family transcriptional regulator n=1 Tax=Marinimicrococcus flavescens TaxID=3031815 RepID=A0AAP3V0A8_9PROT|nr:GntR family transcriptional regulator [Marinimicrococcus flavescens]
MTSADQVAARRLAPVPRTTMQQHVYEALRATIMRGELQPGENVTIQGLADELGTSAMPVREALRRLTAEKALTVVSGRSVGVPPLSAARLADLRRVRVEVEATAAGWAAAGITSAEVDRLRELLETLRRHEDSDDRRTFLAANQEFHFAIYRASRSETLLAIIEQLWLQIGPYLTLLHRSGNWRTANQWHAALLAALEDGDEAAARTAMAADIDEAGEALARMLGD